MGTTRTSAAMLMVEYTLPPTARTTAVMLMVEWGDYVRPDPVAECAPPVDSAHIAVAGTPQDAVSIASPLVDSAHTPIAGIAGGGPVLSPPVADSSHIPVAGIAQTPTDITIAVPKTIRTSLGISIAVFRPTVAAGAYNPEGKYLFNIENIMDGWSHTIGIDGGYKSGSLSARMSAYDLDDWIENGLMRHIVVYSPFGIRIFEGFVNGIGVNYGPLSFNIGPAMDIVNRASVIYSPIYYINNQYVTGDQTETLIAENTDSQGKYGILEAVLSGSNCSDDDADRYRDVYIADTAYPTKTKDISLGAGGFDISLEVMGYGALLDKYIYTNGSELLTTLTAKMRAILEADPNGLYTDFSGLDTNDYLALEGEYNRDKTALTLLQDIIKLGDINDNRWTFGVYAHRKPFYKVEESGITYYQYLGDARQRIMNISGAEIYPWDVLPGKWLYLNDFLPGRAVDSNLRKDPRAMFIEEVTFTSPWGLSLRGGRSSSLPQLLAKQGMSGGY